LYLYRSYVLRRGDVVVGEGGREMDSGNSEDETISIDMLLPEKDADTFEAKEGLDAAQ
jgi:hypothetical protein